MPQAEAEAEAAPRGAAARRPAEAQRAGAAAQRRAAERPGARAQQAAQPLAVHFGGCFGFSVRARLLRLGLRDH
ncbi:hypothetical protein BRDID11002_60820 [Bradyrhizobium diazoefficiens]